MAAFSHPLGNRHNWRLRALSSLNSGPGAVRLDQLALSGFAPSDKLGTGDICAGRVKTVRDLCREAGCRPGAGGPVRGGSQSMQSRCRRWVAVVAVWGIGLAGPGVGPGLV